MFRLLIAKFYLKKVSENDDSPVWDTCVYSYFLVYPFFFALTLLVFRSLERLSLKDEENWLPEVMTHIVASLTYVLIFYFYFVRKGKLESTVNQYAGRSINGMLMNFLLIVVPLAGFCVGPTLTVLLFGGGMLKWEFAGILTPLFER